MRAAARVTRRGPNRVEVAVESREPRVPWFVSFLGRRLGAVRALFADDRALLAGWTHYLAFDLFVGSWEVRDAQRVGVHHLLVAPCLLLTFLLGPVGLLLYFALRAGLRRRLTVGGEAA